MGSRSTHEKGKKFLLDRSPEVLRDVAMATSFGLLMGYNIGCVIASNTLFDSRGGFLGSSCPMKT